MNAQSQLALAKSIKAGDRVSIEQHGRRYGHDTTRRVTFTAACGWYGTPKHEMGGNHLFLSTPDEEVTEETTVRLFKSVRTRFGTTEAHPIIGQLSSVRIERAA